MVIGTEATICSHAYLDALTKHQVESREKACPLLVPLVEEGWTDHAVTEQVAGIYLAEAFADGFSSADVLLLGCTHYPLLKPVLQRVVPKGVALVDSAESTALVVSNLMGKPEKPSPHDSGKIKFFVTDSAQKFQRLGKLFLGRPMTDVTHIELKE